MPPMIPARNAYSGARYGAVGCIYSDPRDDVYFQGDVYPNASFRRSQSVQRRTARVTQVLKALNDQITQATGMLRQL
jgi:hypothetical protein